MLKLRKIAAIVGALILLLTFFTIYTSRELTIFPVLRSGSAEDDIDLQNNKWLHFEQRIQRLEHDMSRHHATVDRIRNVVEKVLSPVSNVTLRTTFDTTSCQFQIRPPPPVDIQMLDVYKQLSFQNVDGGVWKQGWRLEYDEKQWHRMRKLYVHIVPHSHNDPGWIKTVDEYYLAQTKHILNNMLRKLPLDRRRRFIWAEVSFFAMWWEELEEGERQQVRHLLANGQLEIVTGGWVMNDEANTHWLATAHQMTEGHQWLKRHLNYTSTSSWSIDPFGMSSTQPFLLQHLGIKNLLIQRTHYSVKKYLAQQRHLEFYWKQVWSREEGPLTHMMPFYSYDIPHTCGPDPKICCQFDFKRLPRFSLTCPWKVPPVPITETNIAERAELLLDQYRKKSTLFRSNVVLVPLGDDFRYDHGAEWDVQFENYEKLIEYINSKPHLNAIVKFSTLSEYFYALRNRSVTLPTLSGDFFTYADRDDHYWSGYYTSRPFYKRLDRVLLAYVRAAELIHYLTVAVERIIDVVDNNDSLEVARRALALFQHHDGITGTARDYVVVDYAEKLWDAITRCQHIIQFSTQALLTRSPPPSSDNTKTYYLLDDLRVDYKSLDQKRDIILGPEFREQYVTIFNPSTFKRTELVTFHVTTPNIKVVNYEGRAIICQLSPVFVHTSTVLMTKYQLTFEAIVPPIGLAVYKIQFISNNSNGSEGGGASIARVRIYNQAQQVELPSVFRDVIITPSSSDDFTLKSDPNFSISFNRFGLLKSIKIGAKTIPIHLDFLRYGARAGKERSGAYLFLPDGAGVPLPIRNAVVNVIDGVLLSTVIVQLSHIRHTVRVYHPSNAISTIEIENVVDIDKTHNFELAMRFATTLNNSNGDFFTDLNAYQMVRRKFWRKLPLQANYYPMPSAIYIEDAQYRFTLLTATPVGCTSLHKGQIEVMLDRRLEQDDNLGLGQGVLDNIPVKHTFRILLEENNDSSGCQRDDPNSSPAGFLTLNAHLSLETLLNPLIRQISSDTNDNKRMLYTAPSNFGGVDVVLMSTRQLTAKSFGLLLYRPHLNLCYGRRQLQIPISDGNGVNLSAIAPSPHLDVTPTNTIAFLSGKSATKLMPDQRERMPMCSMDMKAFIVEMN